MINPPTTSAHLSGDAFRCLQYGSTRNDLEAAILLAGAFGDYDEQICTLLRVPRTGRGFGGHIVSYRLTGALIAVRHAVRMRYRNFSHWASFVVIRHAPDLPAFRALSEDERAEIEALAISRAT